MTKLPKSNSSVSAISSTSVATRPPMIEPATPKTIVSAIPSSLAAGQEQAGEDAYEQPPDDPADYSHSIVPGGFDVMSSVTRFTCGISLIIREATFSSRS